MTSILEKPQVTELGHAGSWIHKISSTLSKVIGDGGGGGGGGGGALQLRLLFCKIVCHDYFSLQHNVLCLSFVVVLYSMYAVIKMVLLDEGGCHV